MDEIVTTRIYMLSDPTTGRVRYVGKTTCNPKKRLREHACEARSSKFSYHKTRWLRSLGVGPILTEVEVVTGTSEDGSAAERRWISRLRADGCALTNLTDGGEGTVGHVATGAELERLRTINIGRKHGPEVRARMAAGKVGLKRSPEARANMSAAQLRRVRTPEQLAAQAAKQSAAMRGRKLSPEHAAKFSAAGQNAQRGRPRSQEQRERIAATLRGRTLPMETRLKISAAMIGKPKSAETIENMRLAQQKRRAS